MAHAQHQSEPGRNSEAQAYIRFAAMIVTATAVMFGLTYTNVFEVEHIRWSEERLYMSMLMGSAMAVIMLGFMWGMYGNRRLNVAIIASAVAIGAISLWLSRSQYFVDDADYMGAMIPHHSIAILTSERADISDVRVRALADEIAATQRREIAEMEWLLDDIDANGVAATESAAQARPVPDLAE